MVVHTRSWDPCFNSLRFSSSDLGTQRDREDWRLLSSMLSSFLFCLYVCLYYWSREILSRRNFSYFSYLHLYFRFIFGWATVFLLRSMEELFFLVWNCSILAMRLCIDICLYLPLLLFFILKDWSQQQQQQTSWEQGGEKVKSNLVVPYQQNTPLKSEITSLSGLIFLLSFVFIRLVVMHR